MAGSYGTPKIVLVACAYNEGQNLPPLIAECRQLGQRLIVVDDGSQDNTSQVCIANGVEVIRHPTNLGHTGAFVTGMRAAIETDADIIISLDADGQHDPADAPAFVARMQESGADIVVGSRLLGETHPNSSAIRNLMLPYVTKVINLVTGYRMTDAMCGMRAFNAARLRTFAPQLVRMLESNYMSSEMFIRFSHAGFTIDEVPVLLRDRLHGTSTKGMVRYGIGIARAIIRALLDVKVRQ